MKTLANKIGIGAMASLFAVASFAPTVTLAYGGGGGGGGGSSCYQQVLPPPEGFKVDIDDGTDTSAPAQVTLTLHGGTAKTMAIADNETFSNASVVPYSQKVTWSLPNDNDADRKVFVRFYNDCGWSVPPIHGGWFHHMRRPVFPKPPTGGKVLGEKIELVDTLIAKTKFRQRHADVKALQDELKRLGFFPKRVRSTGYYWTITRASVAKYLASKTK